MPSQSSRRKSDSRISLDHVARLLQDGAVLGDPSDDFVASAEQLRRIGIIATETREYVRCANAEDRDFPPKNRHCKGRIYVEDEREATRSDLRCPDCERRVFPVQYHKRRFTELRTRVLCDSVIAYVGSILETLGEPIKQIAPGVFRAEIGEEGVAICIVEYADPKYLARERAVQHPSCFIAVNARDIADRFLAEDWVRRTTLADVICGAIDLRDLVRSAATQGAPIQVRQASLPVCGKGPTSVIAEPLRPSAPERRFVVEVGPNIVRVAGWKVVAEQAGPRFILFRVLWQCFLEDLKAGLPPADFHAKQLTYLIQELEAKTNQHCSDEMTVRRAINRLQKDIEQAVKKNLGLPIDREDIVQTCAWSGHSNQNHGYRLNPFAVIARPFQSNLS